MPSPVGTSGICCVYCSRAARIRTEKQLILNQPGIPIPMHDPVSIYVAHLLFNRATNGILSRVPSKASLAARRSGGSCAETLR